LLACLPARVKQTRLFSATFYQLNLLRSIKSQNSIVKIRLIRALSTINIEETILL